MHVPLNLTESSSFSRTPCSSVAVELAVCRRGCVSDWSHVSLACKFHLEEFEVSRFVGRDGSWSFLSSVFMVFCMFLLVALKVNLGPESRHQHRKT